MKTIKNIDNTLRRNLVILIILIITSSNSFIAQTTIRYHETIQGGVAMIGNSHYLKSTDFGGTAIVNDIDGDGSTTISSSSDLILPTDSSVEYAYLAIETGFEATAGDMTSVKFKVPGGSYITLTNSSTQFLSTKSVLEPSGSRKYRQMLFDVTDLLPATGFTSIAAGGVSGRYFVADPVPTYPVAQRSNMGGWSLIVVYKNESSILRSVTVADNWQFFGSGTNTINTDIANVQLPNGGTVQATVGVTGTYGDPTLSGYGCSGCTDYLKFGVLGTTLTNLTDPVTAVTNDALNSTIGWSTNNDVSFDGGPSISGSYTARNPATGFTPSTYTSTGAWGSAEYDSDIFSAAGILPADGSVQTIRLQQQTSGNDWLVAGSYFLSIEVAPVNLGKSIYPSTIQDGGIATYTFTLDNTSTEAINLTNITFADYLPTGIKIAANPNVTNTCGGTITATPNDTVFTVSGINLNIGDVCIITVDITNVAGQLNSECGTNPVAFTNFMSNIKNSSDALWPNFKPQCLIVLARPTTIDFDGVDDYISRTPFLGNEGEVTMMSWIKLDNSFDGGDIMGQRNFRIYLDSNKQLRTFIKTDSGIYDNITTPTSEAPILSNEMWYHVAVIYDGLKGSIELFLNGNSVWFSNDLTGTLINNQSIWNSDYDFEIGRNSELTNNYFEGAIYETRVYSKVLNINQLHRQINQEIQDNNGAIRGAMIPKDIDGLLWSDLELYYRMDQITNGFTNDESINSIDGELFNITTSQDRTAPLPYETITGGNGEWTDKNNWLYGEVWDITGNHPDCAIVKIANSLSTNVSHSSVGLLIENGAELTVNNDSGIQNSWYVKLAGKIDLEGESQFIQTIESDLQVGTNGSLEKDQQGTKDLYTYNYWSSPVGYSATANLLSNPNTFEYTLNNNVFKDGTDSSVPVNITFTTGYNGSTSPLTISSYWIWKFANQLDDDYSSWQQVRNTGTLYAGEGFTMKGVSDTSGNVSLEQNYVFNGKPNNGDIELNIDAGNDYLVGNPYASALDANQFIIDNGPTIEGTGNTTGTLYFWEHWGGGSHNLADYQGGYAMYNLSGSTATPSKGSSDPDVSTDGSATKLPGRYIPVGQGFFVIGENTGTVKFNNGQRVYQKEGNSSSVFFRTNDTAQNTQVDSQEETQSDERMKLRIGFNSINEIHRQLLITEDANATESIDWGYDAVIYDDQVDDMYWMINDEKFIIQGINAINEASVMPLGLHTSIDGLNTITIDTLENVPNDLEVLVHDLELNIYHNLRDSDYDVFLIAGEYLSRFELVFQNEEALSIEELEQNNLEVYYTNSTNSISIINPMFLEIDGIEMFNILAQSVYKNDVKFVDSETQIKTKNLSTGAYILKLKTEIGLVSKKVIVN